MNIDKYDLELWERIEKLQGYPPHIWSFDKNSLVSLWGNNYKDKIKIETLMEIQHIDYYGEPYQSNFMFTITPEQAKEIIETLQKILKNRKKRK